MSNIELGIFDSVNSRIKNEICYNAIDKLKDANLMIKYRECQSVKNEISALGIILRKYDIDDVKINGIINDYIVKLIPPGTKGVIRGRVFNEITRDTIISLNLDSHFRVEFEKECELYKTDEIPDWYILEKSTSKIIIGMNQLDLWSGGHQLNRGYKYLFNNKYNDEKCKLLCVICNEIQFKSKNKIYQQFEKDHSRLFQHFVELIY